jgi:hypothetical protein
MLLMTGLLIYEGVTNNDINSLMMSGIYVISAIIILMMKSLGDLSTKEFALPVAIVFGLSYIVDREFSTLCVMLIYIVIAIIDIFKTKEEE